MSEAYTSQDCVVFSEALERAMVIYMRAGRLTPETIDIASAALAYGILDAAAAGERNPRRLAIVAAAKVEAYEERLRQQRSWFRNTSDPQAA